MLLFGSRLRSYRDLPMRYAESSTLHRDERGGTLHGLLRVKHITQDDAHVFVTEEQIQPEIDAMIEFARDLYDLFDVAPRRRALDAAGETPRNRRAVGPRGGQRSSRRSSDMGWSTSSARARAPSTGRRSTCT